MAIVDKTTLLNNINTDLADNNAGLISAADIRNNLFNAVDSINTIVSTGDFNSATPFTKNVRAERTVGDTGTGFFIAENGVEFPNAVTDATVQTVPYPGPTGIDHNDLSNRHNNDSHTVFLTLDGSRQMQGNLGFGSNWIGASGHDDVGLKFEYKQGSDQVVGQENIIVGNSGEFVFQTDNSKINTGKSVAKAWCTFDGAGSGGSPVVRNSYNIREIEHLAAGKYRIYLKDGVLDNNSNFVAFGTSNSRTGASGVSDFSINTVGIIERVYDEFDGHYFSFAVLNQAGQYVDAEINDVVVFGESPSPLQNEASSVTITPIS